MGKRLIIKGADFSTNRIPSQLTWFVDEFDQAVAQGRSLTATTVYSAAGFAPNYDFGGKIINVMKLKIAAAGTLSIMIGNSRKDTNAQRVAELQFTSEDVGQVVTKQFEPISIPAGKYLWIGKSGDTASFNYSNQMIEPGSSLGAFWVYMGTNQARQDGNYYEMLCVNFGFIS